MILLLLVPGIGGLAFLIWWLVFETEGVYLGRRVVVWLYDVYARRYDGIKENADEDERVYLAKPLMQRLRPHVDPLVLDVAAGTGRMALALCRHARFEGYVYGLDPSRRMLAVAAEKIAAAEYADSVTLLQGSAEQLPFERDLFDVVTCMEALEFMPQPADQLTELIRVLRPGGLLLTTLRINTRWMPGRVWDETTFRALLAARGMIQIELEMWQYDYMLVWAVKSGTAPFTGVRLPEELLSPALLRQCLPYPASA
ncbi:MAG: methyltransferase domain-containing protein [Anaerolineae bacterium]|jgi:ubiquinone/menaquinone biosynthesis C-methylase UbiE|nr:methyltransferase domain-containing protein [Anaerolineae bacterium]